MACCLTAPSHYRTNVDLSSVRSSGIHLRAILQEIPQPSVTEIGLKITYLKFCSNLPGADELISMNWSLYSQLHYHVTCKYLKWYHCHKWNNRKMKFPLNLKSEEKGISEMGPWSLIDPSHKSHNAPGLYPIIHHFGTERGPFLFQSDVLWDVGQVHCGIEAEMCTCLFLNVAL